MTFAMEHNVHPDGPQRLGRLLRPAWVPVFGDAFRLACLLAAMAVALRAVAMLGRQAPSWLLPAGFLLLAVTPHLFFRQEGRRRAGLRLPGKPQWLLGGVVLGAAAAWLLHWLGVTLFGTGAGNWYISVRRALPIEQMAGLPEARLFWFLAIPSMVFSPLGEELFFRGLLEQAAAERWNQTKGILFSAGWFGVIHLLHHGIARVDGELHVQPLSGALWMALIFATGALFSLLRLKTGSLLAPILSHAAFNLTLTYAVLYLL